jgi:hypothetical protein
MSKTKTELATRALSIVGKVQAGQTPAAEDLTLVEGVAEALVEQLNATQVCYVGDIDAVEDSYYLPLARRLALEIGPDFGLPAVDDDTIKAANAALRRLGWSGPTLAVVQAVSF